MQGLMLRLEYLGRCHTCELFSPQERQHESQDDKNNRLEKSRRHRPGTPVRPVSVPVHAQGCVLMEM